MAIFIIALIVLAIKTAPKIGRIINEKRKARKNKEHFTSTVIGKQGYLNIKQLFLQEFKHVPSISTISQIDIPKAYQLIINNTFGNVKRKFEDCSYNWERQINEFANKIMILEQGVIIHLTSYNEVQLFYCIENYAQIESILKQLSSIKKEVKTTDYEINILSKGSYGLELKTVKTKPTFLDISKWYNDDFEAVHKTIVERLGNTNDKGIVLLHGLPGAGKTTYIRYLLGCINKTIMFLPPNIAGELTNPEFIDLLVDNPNSVIVIEDAENIIMDRNITGSNSVSSLLNISDGLLSDFLNIQIVCTFNSALHTIDKALLRKGRLIAKYEFGRLTVDKAQALSTYIGKDTQVTKPMTIAEITNPDAVDYQHNHVQVIGFRRNEIATN
jgi:hypothetical protein